MDSFWITWFVGIALVVGVRIYRFVIDDKYWNSKKSKKHENLILVLSLICIAIVGGIIVAKWVGNFALVFKCNEPTDEGNMCTGCTVFMIITTILGAAITYAVGYPILGFYRFDEIWANILAVVIFILSITAWSIPIWKYNENIEYKAETVTKTEQRELIYFSGIPVKQAPGDISEDATLNSGEVKGEVSTSDEIAYWYVNKSGKGVQGKANSSNSEMDFFEEGTAYVEIITNTTYTTKINHNNGKEGEAKEDSKSVKYIFHLPEYVTQYSMG